MKSRKRILYLIILLSAAAAAFIVYSYRQARPNIVSWFVGDIDGDSENELLIITAENTQMKLETGEAYGDTLMVYSEYKLRHDMPVTQGEPDAVIDLTSIKPLKVLAGDIDGDGLVEIGVCVYKTTKFHSVLAKRPFFYALTDGKLEPVWLGSRLARPFEDYLLYDLDEDGIDEIISIEMAQNGNHLLAMYDWKGFGFEMGAISDEIPGAAAFLNNTNKRQDGILVNIVGTQCSLRLADGKLVTTH